MYTLSFERCIPYEKITTIKVNDIPIASTVGIVCVWAHEYACACGRIFNLRPILSAHVKYTT